MVHYTTPEFTFIINDDNVNLNDANHVYVTFEQGSKKITKTDNDLSIEDGKIIKVWFDQNDSEQFETGTIMVQINWTCIDSQDRVQRFATGIKRVPITQNLLQEVVE